MTDIDDTGNRARLPFEELPIEVRARAGSLVGKSLTIKDVAKLQFPNDLAGELAWRLKLIYEFTDTIRWRKYERGIQLVLGSKEFYKVSPDLYAGFLRETKTQASELITRWLGWTPPGAVEPLPQSEPDRPESGAVAKRETEVQMHRRECQEIGKRLWAENPKAHIGF